MQWGNFYQLSVDPEYTLLYNGIIVSTGSFAINFIDHPATPTIFISGISSLLVRLFTAEGSYVQDFLRRPETYLHASQAFQLLLTLFCCLYASIKIEKFSNRKWLSFIPIVGLFSHYHLVEISIRFLPETTILLPLLLLMALLIQYIYHGEKIEVQKKLSWQIPLLVAFGIACKLSFAPFILLPISLFSKNKHMLLKTLRNTFLFSLLFAYPLFTNFSHASQWIGNMLSHSGKHGAGENNFIAFEKLPLNFKELLADNPFFWFLLLSNAFILIHLYFMPYASQMVKRSRQVLIGLLLSTGFLVILILKHFALHYLMPFYVLSGLLLAFLLLYFQLIFNYSYKYQAAILAGTSALLLGLNFAQSKSFITDHEHWKTQQIIKQKEVLAKLNDVNAPLIIDAPHWGSPFPAYAHAFGFMHTYKRKTYFKKELREKYPKAYINVGWMPEFNHWDQFVDFDHIFSQSKVVFLYSEGISRQLSSIISRLDTFKNKGHSIQQKQVWKNEDGSQLIRLEYYQ